MLQKQSKPNLTPEFLDRCRKITKAFIKKNDGIEWSLNEQLLHIYSEVGEVQRAMRNGSISNLHEELCDVILTCITMFDQLGVSYEEIQKMMEYTLNKVETRCGIAKY